uniref:B box-type domain-containing protein n=1 Tax=Arundo donax TaxID=35708 RepID=A0A0A9DNS7_ARUDO
MGMRPGWVGGLVAETFFASCPAHESRKKNEKNIFCLGCCASICPHCAPAHSHHPLLQVRRYVYHDVVRLGDIEKLIDCSYVQSYTINNAKVIFLKPRPQSRPFKGSGNVCLTCERMLQEPFHFCSLSCKVDHVMTQGGDLSNILQYYGEPDHLAFPRFENLRVDGSDLDDDTDGGQVTPNSILEDPVNHYGGVGGGSSDNGDTRVGNGGSARRGEAAAAKRKKGGGFFPQIMLSLGNRRKGAPHRSPLA